MVADVLVLGGGFGGLAAATTLRRLLGDEHTITVVDARDSFYMGFAKLWDLAGLRPLSDGTRSLRQLEHRGIRFEQRTITAIDAHRRRIETTDGPLQGDAMIVALGAGADSQHAAMLAGPKAHDAYDGEALAAMKADLQTVERGRVVVSILGGPHKCPPAPFEISLIVSERLRERGVRDDVEVVITTPKPMTLPVAGPDASHYVSQHLDQFEVKLLAEHSVTDVDSQGQSIGFADGSRLGYDLLLGVPANVAPDVVAACDLVGPSGWIEPDRHTLRTDVDRVYAVGDCTMIPTSNGQLPMAGVFAAATGRVAAANVAADLIGTEPSTYDGRGHCFLELPGERVAFVTGNFYSDPPDVTLSEADHDQFLRKQTYETETLDGWFG